MIISVISDCHLGFSPDERLEDDSYRNFELAFNKALNDSDLILLAGDIFDNRAPKTKAWAYALKILSKATLVESRGVKLIETDKKLKEASVKTLSHIPIIAIHGNHEIRARGEINAIEALENAGLLIYLDRNYVLFEKDGERVCIFGMSHVQERLAKETLDKWNPNPRKDAFNILLMHQNIYPYVYSQLEQPTLTTENLPTGFDIIINGHIHLRVIEKIGNSLLVVPGSTVITQFQPSEADSMKGYIRLDTASKKVEFIPIESRKFFYEVMEIKENENGKEKIERRIREIIFKNIQPVIKFKIIGEISEKDLRDLERKYYDSAVVLFSKTLESEELTKKIEFVRNAKEERLSLDELGISILRKSLKELGFKDSFDFQTIFNLLKDEEVDVALKLLLGEQSTLRMVK